jgi:Superinfection immunity protein
MGSLSIWHWMVLAILFSLYLLHGIIASKRDQHNKGAVWALNIVAGWTLIGWIGAFIWAFTNPAKPQIIYVNTPQPPSAN